MASQVHATDSKNTATAIDMLCIENNQPLLLELKSTMYENQFFSEKGTLLNSTLPYSDATAALLQSEVCTQVPQRHTLTMCTADTRRVDEKQVGITKTKNCCHGRRAERCVSARTHAWHHKNNSGVVHAGYCKIVRPTPKLQQAAEKYAELLMECV